MLHTITYTYTFIVKEIIKTTTKRSEMNLSEKYAKFYITIICQVRKTLEPIQSFFSLDENLKNSEE